MLQHMKQKRWLVSGQTKTKGTFLFKGKMWEGLDLVSPWLTDRPVVGRPPLVSVLPCEAVLMQPPPPPPPPGSCSAQGGCHTRFRLSATAPRTSPVFLRQSAVDPESWFPRSWPLQEPEERLAWSTSHQSLSGRFHGCP